jgi:hypothetical protein
MAINKKKKKKKKDFFYGFWGMTRVDATMWTRNKNHKRLAKCACPWLGVMPKK